MTAQRSTGSWWTRSTRLLAATLLFLAPVASTATAPAQAATTSGPTWSKLSPPTSPPALRGAAAAYDAADQTVVVFGGELPDGALSNQTWVWNGTTWSRVDQGFGSVPPARSGASMAYDSHLDQLILFGGEGGGHTLLDDTWLWNGASWIQVTAPSTPGARTDAAFAPDHDGHLVLFGGYGTSNASSDQPVTSSTSTSSTSAPSSTSSTSASSSTSSTSASSSTSSTTTVGGTSTTSTPSTTSTIVTSTGSTITSTTTSSATTTRSNGGDRARSASPAVLDDTWLLESTSQGDDWVPVTTPVHPARTEGATAVETSGGTVLFGGSGAAPTDAATALSDRTWNWSGSTWSLVRTSGSPPASDAGVVVDDPAIGGVVAFGGVGASGPLAGVWELAGGRWQPLATASTPAARTDEVGVYDAASRQVLVFGGAGSTGRPLDSTIVLAARPPVTARSSPSTTSTTSTTSRTRSSTSSSSSSTSTSRRSTGGTAGGGSSSSGRSSKAKATSIHPGDVVTLEGHGFAPDARVVVTFEPTHRVVAVTRANGSGQFRLAVTVPDGAKVGRHDFVATGSGPSGPVDLVTPVEVAAYTHPSPASPATAAILVALAVAVPALTLIGLRVFGRGHPPVSPS